MGESTDFQRVFEASPEPQLLLAEGSIVLTEIMEELKRSLRSTLG
jgi:hypothetical protein